MHVYVTTYNKVDQIGKALQRITEVLNNSGVPVTILVLDDGSTDGSPQYLTRLQEQFEFELVCHDSNRGRGAVLREHLAKSTAPLVALFDGDLDIHPAGLVTGYNLLVAHPSIGAAIASKLHPNSKVDYPVIRRIGSKLFRFLSSLMIGLPIRDPQTGLKVLRGCEIRELIPILTQSGHLFDLELLARMSERGLEIREIPVNITMKFKSSIGLYDTFEMLGDLVTLRRSLKATNGLPPKSQTLKNMRAALNRLRMK